MDELEGLEGEGGYPKGLHGVLLCTSHRVCLSRQPVRLPLQLAEGGGPMDTALRHVSVRLALPAAHVSSSTYHTLPHPWQLLGRPSLLVRATCDVEKGSVCGCLAGRLTEAPEDIEQVRAAAGWPLPQMRPAGTFVELQWVANPPMVWHCLTVLHLCWHAGPSAVPDRHYPRRNQRPFQV